MDRKGKGISRRDFLKAGALGMGAAVGAGVAGPLAAQEKPGDIPLRPLGKTGVKVSAIAFGGYVLPNPGVLESAMDRGINLIETAAEYANGASERAIGEVMKKRRDQAIISTGWPPAVWANATAVLTALDESLKRLQTDHIDVMRLHGCDDPDALAQPSVVEAFTKAKDAGKAKFLGVSGHGKRLPEVWQKAVDSKAFHVLQGKLSFVEYANMSDVVKKAGEQGLGVVAFKSTAGKEDPFIKELTGKGMDFARACVKWALNNEAVSSVIFAFKSLDDVKGVTVGLAEPLSEYEERLLAIYREAVAHTYCRYCGACAEGCANNVAVADIMRYRMYFRCYGLEKEAMRLYAAIPEELSASRCASCSGDCLGRCPHGLPTRDNLLAAHSMLT